LTGIDRTNRPVPVAVCKRAVAPFPDRSPPVAEASFGVAEIVGSQLTLLIVKRVVARSSQEWLLAGVVFFAVLEAAWRILNGHWLTLLDFVGIITGLVLARLCTFIVRRVRSSRGRGGT
jgi:hypothetical protein